MSLEMMDEHERSERVRRWLHENSGSLLGGVAAGLLCFSRGSGGRIPVCRQSKRLRQTISH